MVQEVLLFLLRTGSEALALLVTLNLTVYEYPLQNTTLDFKFFDMSP